MKPRVNIALIGYQFMGRAHSHALKMLHMLSHELSVDPVMKVICGRNESDLEKVAGQFGWEQCETDWRQVVADPQVDIVDIVAPGKLHAQIAIAAAEHGKHVFCEKPLALNLADAVAMHDAAEKHAVKHMVNFNYRRVPAILLAKKILESKKLGDIYHFSATYQQDWPLDPSFPFIWRFDKETAGAGSMADKGSHIIDLARYLVGEFDSVASRTKIFVEKRLDSQQRPQTVTTDDAAVFIAQFQNGALGSFQTSRMSAGHKNALAFEINGSSGSLRFHLERLNELEVYFSGEDPQCEGFRTVSVTNSEHPYMSNWWPPGHVLGWEHTFVHQWQELLTAISDKRMPTPSFRDGVECQKVIEAVTEAEAKNAWVKVA